MVSVNLVISKQLKINDSDVYYEFFISSLKNLIDDNGICPKKRFILNLFCKDLKSFHEFRYDLREKLDTNFDKNKLDFIYGRLRRGCEIYIIEDDSPNELIEIIQKDFIFGYDIVKIN
jgi:hypothetical protein